MTTTDHGIFMTAEDLWPHTSRVTGENRPKGLEFSTKSLANINMKLIDVTVGFSVTPLHLGTLNDLITRF